MSFSENAPHLAPDLLYTSEGLAALDIAFLGYLGAQDEELLATLKSTRLASAPLSKLDESRLILKLAPHLEAFLIDLFSIEDAYAQRVSEHKTLGPILAAKRQFVQRSALREHTLESVLSWDAAIITSQAAQVLGGGFDEALFATRALDLLDHQPDSQERYHLSQYAAWAVLSPEGKKRHHKSTLFTVPAKVDFSALLSTAQEAVTRHANRHSSLEPLSPRDGFGLTDKGLTTLQALDEATYCIWCHNQQKDSCSTGLRHKTTGEFIKNPAQVTLTGCPLEEKISEMNWLKSKGQSLAALAVITIDNPMVAATGHRICNDCMKSCIYQKQAAVNIPGVETSILQNVLDLPWGFEIYSLLTRWNPLNVKRPLPRPQSGYHILVAGMGPAGFTLAHHLMNDGHAVVGIDGLKIEPLPPQLTGRNPHDGLPCPFHLIEDTQTLFDDLDDRIIGGFGGVAEYGITVRWNKNYLKLIRLLLERRQHFRLFDGIRLGGTLTTAQAFNLGFDHIALCLGAGKPTVIPMKNNLAKGVRQASDFLMALQLTGAAKWDSLANLQIRLPILVIGGGLTAIDTATEALAYYPRQVLKFARRHAALVKTLGQAVVEQGWTAEDRQIANQYLDHAAQLQQEVDNANRENRPPAFGPFLQQWGGATVVYRRSLNEAPSVTLNHEEVAKALEEGITVVDHLTPHEVHIDSFGWIEGLACRDSCHDGEGASLTLPARTLMIAAGTSPNIALASDDHALTIEGKSFQALDHQGNNVTTEKIAKPEIPAIFTHIHEDGRRVSFFGDLHPSYAGNVVKAMGSAKQGYPLITAHLHGRAPAAASGENGLLAQLHQALRATVKDVRILSPRIVEVVVHAPLAAAAFKPGQFYRLQNYETHAPLIKGTRMAMEGLALTGASVDTERGLISTIVLEMGGSSDLCRHLKPGEPVVFMGPTGTPTDIPAHGTVMLLGGGLGNAVLFSIGKALRQQGSRVLYFAGYKTPADVFKQDDIEAAADSVVWCCDTPHQIPSRRAQDFSFSGNIIEAVTAYARGTFHGTSIPLAAVDHMIVIGSDGMMAAVARAREIQWQEYFPRCHTAMGSINSPMQCMMKEICGQCLQRHINPATGEEQIVFSCVNQDQPLSHVDFGCLKDRLQQNQLQEKLTKLWIQHCLQGAC